MTDLISFSGSSVTLEGRLFEGDAARRIKERLAQEVRVLGEKGRRLAAENIKTKNGTGYTAANLEMYQEYRNSLFAVVRMQPGLERPPGSALYPASRRPYIVNAVLASGRYGNRRKYDIEIRIGRRGARKRRKYLPGVERQPALNHFSKAATVLRRDARNFRAEILAKELA